MIFLVYFLVPQHEKYLDRNMETMMILNAFPHIRS